MFHIEWHTRTSWLHDDITKYLLQWPYILQRWNSKIIYNDLECSCRHLAGWWKNLILKDIELQWKDTPRKFNIAVAPPKKSSLLTSMPDFGDVYWRIHHWWYSTFKTNPPPNTNMEPQKIRSLFNRRFHHPLSASIPCIHFLCRILPNNIRPKSWESKGATPPNANPPPN